MQSKAVQSNSKFHSLNNRVWSTAIGEHIGQRVRVSGWLHRLRRLSNVTFLILRDRKGLAQIVIEDPQVIAQLDDVYHESVLHVEGRVVLNPQAPNGVEIHEPYLEVVSCAEPQPFDLFRPTINAQLPTLLDNAPIYWRHLRQRAVWQIAAATMSGFRGTLHALDFTEIQTPKIVASATEGGANLFAIDYMGKAAYLAQSPQFYKQMMVGVFERVFEIGPVFRAEPHSTPRHLNEYVSMDVELGFIQSHHTVMQVLRHVLSGLLDALHIQAQEALELLEAV